MSALWHHPSYIIPTSRLSHFNLLSKLGHSSIQCFYRFLSKIKGLIFCHDSMHNTRGAVLFVYETSNILDKKYFPVGYFQINV